VSVLEKLIEQRERVRNAEVTLGLERAQQLRLMREAKAERYRNVELAKAMGLSRERVSTILKGSK
jgi:hypothetical protein